MQNAGNKNPGKMLAIIGASKEQIQFMLMNILNLKKNQSLLIFQMRWLLVFVT